MVDAPRLDDRAPSLGADAWGGLAAALVAFPSSIAFGVVVFSAVGPDLAGQGALAGILGAAVLGVVAPLVGRIRGLITAPCAPAAAVLSAVAVDLAGQRIEAPRIVALLSLTAALSAVFQLGFGALRAGRVIKYIPYQVVSGYLSGVALIIAAAQIPKLLGAPKGAHLLDALLSPSLWRWHSIVVGVTTMAVMFVAPKVTSKVPGAILGLLAGTAVYFALGFVDPALRTLDGNALVIGPIKAQGGFLDGIGARLSGLTTLGIDDVARVLGPALTLSVLLSIDTLKTGVVLDAMTRQRSDADRSLLGQGVANLVSFVVGGLAGAGTTGPTLVNLASGGRSLRSGVLEGVFVFAVLVAAGPLVAWVPTGALAGILLAIAARMFDVKMFALARSKATRLDFFVIAAVVVVAEGVGLIQASAVGVGLAILLFLREQMRASIIWHKGTLADMRSKRRRSAEENEILSERGGAVAVVQLRGSLFFGTTDQLFTELESELRTVRYLMFDLRLVRSIDFTAVNLLKQMQQRVAERGGCLVLCELPTSPEGDAGVRDYLAELGLTGDPDGHGRDPPVRVFETRDAALEWLENTLLEQWGWSPPESRPLRIGEIRVLRGLPDRTLAEVQGAMRELTVAAGDAVFRAGDAGDDVFFVRKGRVHALLPMPGGKTHHLATFGQGEYFGEMAFLDSSARSADAVAAVDTLLFALSRKAVNEIARKDPVLTGQLFEHFALAVAERLRMTDREITALEA